jgi:hypothetical protein
MDDTRYRYAPEERETIIRWDQSPADAEIFTCDPVLIRRLAAKGVQPTRIERSPDGKEFGRAYTVPKRWVKVTPPRRPTDAQREHGRRMAARRANAPLKT